MIGRFSGLESYREIFRSGEVLKWLGGAILIPLGYLLNGFPLPGLPALTLGSLLFLASIALNGLPIIIGAIRGLLAREINVDELVSIALIACLVSGNYAEGAIVSAIMVLGSLVEEAVSDRARDSIRALIAMSPDTAVVERDGTEQVLELQEVRQGDILLIRPGDTIPVDGSILDGALSVNEASITGESMPVDRSRDASVCAGTVCVDGFARIRAERVGEDSTLGRIIQMVEAAEQQQTESGRIVDRYAAWFTPIILVCAALTYLLTRDPDRAITVLIVGCPCSFLLASPVTTVAAISRAAKAGILVKGGPHLENLAVASAFFFDKTGTLTQGRPELAEVHPANGFSEAEVIRLAAAVEKGSLHPLGIAIVARAEALGLEPTPASDIHTEIGRGISGRVEGRLVEVRSSHTDGDRALTTVDVLVDGRPAGTLGLFDPAREGAGQAIQALREEGITELVILSGDRPSAVRKLAEELGLDRYHAAQKPDEKGARINAYTLGKTVFIGDGINDAPALKTASTGIAMGGRGVDVALETADVVLMNDRLDQLPFLVRLGRRMSRTIKQGILLSLAINLAAVIASFSGLLTPILGAITHNLGSILVVSLAASLRFAKGPQEQRLRLQA